MRFLNPVSISSFIVGLFVLLALVDLFLLPDLNSEAEEFAGYSVSYHYTGSEFGEEEGDIVSVFVPCYETLDVCYDQLGEAFDQASERVIQGFEMELVDKDGSCDSPESFSDSTSVGYERREDELMEQSCYLSQSYVLRAKG